MTITCLSLIYSHILGMMKDDDKQASQNPQSERDIASDGITAADTKTTVTNKQMPVERGGPKGPEPTRYGDWEKGGRCTDF